MPPHPPPRHLLAPLPQRGLSGQLGLIAGFWLYVRSRAFRTNPRPYCIRARRLRHRLAPGSRIEVGRSLFLGGQVRGYPSPAVTVLNMGAGARFRVGGSFTFLAGCLIDVSEHALLELGGGYANHGSRIVCTSHIVVGRDVRIADQVTIMDSDFHSVDGRPVSAPIRIGDHVWIGTRATVLKGVTIGDGAVVAAGAVVTRDVPERCVAAGVPARVRRRNVTWQ